MINKLWTIDLLKAEINLKIFIFMKKLKLNNEIIKSLNIGKFAK
jgi:hypothetical protein